MPKQVSSTDVTYADDNDDDEDDVDDDHDEQDDEHDDDGDDENWCKIMA